MRQAGRYMPEYRAVRKQHSLLEICKKPALAAEVTITAAEILGVDAAIIFADLLLPLEVMGLPFISQRGEGPVIEKPVASKEDIANLRTDRAADLGYVSEAVALVAKHFGDRAARHRILRRSFHPCQLHDRGWRIAELCPRQEDDVQPARRLGRADEQTGCRDQRRILRSRFARAPTPFRFSTAGWDASALRTTGGTFCPMLRAW